MPSPYTSVGLRTTAGTPEAAARSTTSSAAIFDSAYGPRPSKGALSETAPRAGSLPYTAVELTCTNRATRARQAARTTVAVPPTMTRA